MYDRAPRVLTGATGSTTDEVGPGKYEPDTKRSLDGECLHFLHCLYLRHVEKGGREGPKVCAINTVCILWYILQHYQYRS